MFKKLFIADNQYKTNVNNKNTFTRKSQELDRKDVIRSPFFYVGDKYKLMSQLLKIFPSNIRCYYEPFCGGGSSFLNIKVEDYVLNDIDSYMINMHKMLIRYSKDPNDFLMC